MASTTEMALSFTVGAAVASSFQNSFNLLAGRIRSTQQEVLRLTQAYDAAKNAAGGMTSAQAQLGQQLKLAQSNLTQLTKIQQSSAAIAAGKGALLSSLPAVMTFAAPIKTAMDFEQAMKNVGAICNASADDIAKMTKQARELGASTVFSASEAADGMQYLAMAGFNTEQTLAAMPGMLDLAAAGNTELGRTADIASNILSGFGLKAEEMGRVADILTKTFTTSNTTLEMLGDTMKYVAPVAASVGMSIEDCAAAVGILGNSGIQSSQAGTVLRSALLRLSAPPTEAAKALESLGMSTKDAQGNVRPMVDILEELNEKTAKMGSGQKSGIFTKIFGMEAASGMVTLAASAGKQIKDANGNITTELREYMAKVNNASGTAQQVAGDRMKTTAGALEEMKGAIEDMCITLGNLFLPILSKMMLKIADFVAGLSEFAQKHSVVTGAIMGVVSAMVLLKPLMAIGSIIGNSFMIMFRSVVLAKNAMLMLTAANIKATAIMVIQKAQMIASAVATGAMTAAQWLLNVAMTANPIGLVIVGITALIAGMVALYKWCEPVRQVFDAVFGWIGEKIAWVTDKFSGLGSAVKKIAGWFGFGGGEEAPAGGTAAGAGAGTAANTGTKTAAIPTSALPSVPKVPNMGTANTVAAPTAVSSMSSMSAMREVGGIANTAAVPAMPSVKLPQAPNIPTVGNGGIAAPSPSAAISVNQSFSISGVNPESAKAALEAAQPEFEKLVRRVIKVDTANKIRVGYN